jgi:hypothetical protein
MATTQYFAAYAALARDPFRKEARGFSGEVWKMRAARCTRIVQFTSADRSPRENSLVRECHDTLRRYALQRRCD